VVAIAAVKEARTGLEAEAEAEAQVEDGMEAEAQVEDGMEAEAEAEAEAVGMQTGANLPIVTEAGATHTPWSW
jgi:hypothetical protein